MEYVRPLLPGLFALVFATSLSAQEVSGPALDPDRGPSIALGAGAGTTVGLWTAVGERTDVGLELQASLTRLTQGEAAERGSSAAVGLLFKRFLDGDGDVAPYPFTLEPEEEGTTGFSVRTLTSGIRVHLYLR